MSVPRAVQLTARRALEWRRVYHRGGTEIGVARARDLSNDRAPSSDVLSRMRSYFKRHVVDARALGFRRGEDGYPSAGRVAWDLWGGDAAVAWFKHLGVW